MLLGLLTSSPLALAAKIAPEPQTPEQAKRFVAEDQKTQEAWKDEQAQRDQE